MNVFDAAKRRIELTMKSFNNVYVSFSGGKDSGVMLELAIGVARESFPGRKIGVYHVDYEGQYQMTTDYVTRTLESNLDVIEPFWMCLPVSVQCATSMYQQEWICWDNDVRDIWCRDMPESAHVVSEANAPDFFVKGMSDYDLNKKFHHWYRQRCGGDDTACLVGIRMQESLQRRSAIYHKFKMFEDWKWTSEGARKGLWNVYPVFDWTAEDIWAANARNGWDYNELYDLYYQAGLTVNQMRVASPFNDCAGESLHWYKAIEPNTWAKLVGRVNGANFTSIYGGTKAQGFKDITLPAGHTWKTYCTFLLKTLPKSSRDTYLKKFEKSVKYWTEDGGAVSMDTASEIKELPIVGHVEFLGKPTNKRRYTFDKEIVRFETYPDDIEVTRFQEVPSYKRFCVTIMKNDHSCKYMGFGQTKFELERRAKALDTYKDAL